MFEVYKRGTRVISDLVFLLDFNHNLDVLFSFLLTLNVEVVVGSL